MNDDELPVGWRCESVYRIGNVCAGVGFPERLQGRVTGDVPFFKVGDISRAWQSGDPVLRRAEHYVSSLEAKSLGRLLPQHTTVFAKIGAAISLNRRSLLAQPSLVDNNVFGVVPGPAIDPRFLFHFFCTLRFIEDSRATTVPSLRKDDVGEKLIPVPPLPEQRRIVDALDSYLSRLDDAIANLERVRRNLGRYRSSVLQAAVEGRLVPTEAELAKAEGRMFEPASVLLKRILAERRKRWETSGKKGKYEEPVGPNTEGLPELPEGWCWATLPQLGELNRGKSKHRPRNDPRLLGGPHPFIQTGDVRHSDGFITTYSATYSDFGLAQSRLWPAGTVCITIAANIAETGILGLAACFPDSVVGFLNESDPILVRYVELFVRTAKANLARYAPATAQKNINLEILSGVAVCLPPAAEQARIVAEVDRLLSVATASEAVAQTNIQRLRRLRQSVLKWAFEGKLVDQEVADGPFGGHTDTGSKEVRSQTSKPDRLG